MGGWKTWTATIGYGLCELVKTFAPQYTDLATAMQNTLFLPLGVLGIGSKIDRAGPPR